MIKSAREVGNNHVAFSFTKHTRRNREGGSFFVAAPDNRGEMKFGEVRGGESRARRTLRRSRKPCQVKCLLNLSLLGSGVNRCFA